VAPGRATHVAAEKETRGHPAPPCADPTQGTWWRTRSPSRRLRRSVPAGDPRFRRGKSNGERGRARPPRPAAPRSGGCGAPGELLHVAARRETRGRLLRRAPCDRWRENGYPSPSGRCARPMRGGSVPTDHRPRRSVSAGEAVSSTESQMVSVAHPMSVPSQIACPSLNDHDAPWPQGHRPDIGELVHVAAGRLTDARFAARPTRRAEPGGGPRPRVAERLSPAPRMPAASPSGQIRAPVRRAPGGMASASSIGTCSCFAAQPTRRTAPGADRGRGWLSGHPCTPDAGGVACGANRTSGRRAPGRRGVGFLERDLLRQVTGPGAASCGGSACAAPRERRARLESVSLAQRP